MALVDQDTFAALMAGFSSDRGRLQRLLDQPDGLAGLLQDVRRILGLTAGEDGGSGRRMSKSDSGPSS